MCEAELAAVVALQVVSLGVPVAAALENCKADSAENAGGRGVNLAVAGWTLSFAPAEAEPLRLRSR
jgi:hypothetical protein